MSAKLFDARYYADLNPDLKAAGLTTEKQLRDHFDQYGVEEGRQCSPLPVDLDFYAASNPDLKAAGLTTKQQLWDHLEKFGMGEMRKFSPLIDLKFYQESNPDLASLSSEQLVEHLQTYGIAEERQFSPFVDLKFYQESNADLAGLSKGQLFEHLVTYGMAEERQFSRSIDLKFYQQGNADLAGLSGAQLFDHLLNFGFKEGRKFSVTFTINDLMVQVPNFDWAQVLGVAAGSTVPAGTTPVTPAETSTAPAGTTQVLPADGSTVPPDTTPVTPTDSSNPPLPLPPVTPAESTTVPVDTTTGTPTGSTTVPADTTTGTPAGSTTVPADTTTGTPTGSGNVPGDIASTPPTGSTTVPADTTTGTPTGSGNVPGDIASTPPTGSTTVPADTTTGTPAGSGNLPPAEPVPPTGSGNLPPAPPAPPADGDMPPSAPPQGGFPGQMPGMPGQMPPGMSGQMPPGMSGPMPGPMPGPSSGPSSGAMPPSGAISSSPAGMPQPGAVLDSPLMPPYNPEPPENYEDIGVLGDTQNINDSVSEAEPQDNYRFTVSEFGEVNLTISGLSSSAYVSVLDSQGYQINSAYGDSAQPASLTSLLKPGDYFVQVNSSGGETDYTLSLGAAAPTAIGSLSSPQTVSESVGQSDRADSYSFTVDSFSEVSVLLEGLTSGADVQVFNSEGNYVTSVWSDGTQPGSASSLLKPGTYYLLVSGYDSDTNYTVNLEATAPTDIGTLSGQTEPVSDSLSATDSTDYFAFTLAESSELSLTLDGLSAGAYINVLDPDGNYIGWASSDGTQSASLSNLLLNEGTYYVQVTGSGGETNYTLDLSATPKAIPADNAGNTKEAALDQGVLSDTPVDASDWVGNPVDPTDYYKFTLETSSELSLTLDGVSGQGPSVNLLDSEGNYINWAWDDGTNPASLSSLLEADTYYIQVDGYASNTDYTLDLSATPKAIPDDPAGETLEEAQQLGALGATQTVSAWVDSRLDPSDYFAFSLDASSRLDLSLDGLTGQGASVSLLDSSGNWIGGMWSDSTQSGSLSNLLDAGTYYVQVYGYWGSTEYDLNLSATPEAIPADNAGNTPEEALDLGALSDIQPVSDWVGTPVDANDYYKFTTDSAGGVSVTLDGLSAGASVYVLDSNQGYITGAYGDGTTPASVSATLPEDGTYFVQVSTYQGDTEYTLEVVPGEGDTAGNPMPMPMPADQGIAVGEPAPGTSPGGSAPVKPPTDQPPADQGIAVGEPAPGTNPDGSAPVQPPTGKPPADQGIAAGEPAPGTSPGGSMPVKPPTDEPPAEQGIAVGEPAPGTSPPPAPMPPAGMVPAGPGADPMPGGMPPAGMVPAGPGADPMPGGMPPSGMVPAGPGADPMSGGMPGGMPPAAPTPTPTPTPTPAPAAMSVAGGPGMAAGDQAPGKMMSGAASIPIDLMPPVEPVDLQSAQDIGTLGATQTLSDSVTAADSDDLYRFTVDSTGEASFSLTGLSSSANFNLLDSNGNNINGASGDSTYPGVVNTLLPPGTYYLQVNGYGSETNYQLSWGGTPPTDIGSLSSPQTVSDSVGQSDPNDYYTFTLDASSQLSLNLNGLSGSGYVNLLDKSGQYINGAWNDGTTAGSLSNLLDAGKYYLQVSGYGADSDYTLDLSATAKAIPLDGAGSSTADAAELDISSGTQSVSDWLGNPVDRSDYYSFTLDSSSSVSLNLDGLSSGVSFNLLDSSGNYVNYGWGDATTAASLSSLLQAGTYYVAVEGYWGETDYTLNLSATAKEIPADNAGNTLDLAKDLGVLSSPQTASDWVDNYIDPTDYYKFTLDTSSKLNLTLDGLSKQGAYVHLLDSSGNYINYAWSDGTTPASLSSLLDTGTYYVQVSGGYGGDTDFSLNLSATPEAIPQDTAGSTPAEAIDLGALSQPQTVSEWVDSRLDPTDTYEFTLAESSEVSLGLDSLTGAASVTLLDSNEQYVTGAWGDATTAASATRLLAAGTYYAQVSASASDVDYALNLSATAKAIPADGAGNTPEGAKALGDLSAAQTLSDWVGSPIDPNDYYSFTLPAAGTVSLTVSGLSAGAGLTLYDSNQVYLNGSYGDGANPASLSQQLAAGSYLVQVSSWEQTDYNLSLSPTV
ncbi:MAG: pre-peptidase C-terminal domain-containing protein [Oscillatoria princeps RMCB-10]|jgi:hypothetical protein|nr:pre-peptidase C-terminal domain-containing protein [Oscillatoria princeps RMCB-10]